MPPPSLPPDGRIPMSSRVYAGEVTEISPGEGVAVAVHRLSIAVFNASGELFALDNACARCGAPLAPGPFAPPYVKCGSCGWRYDVMTGAVEGLEQIRLDSYRVSVSGSRVYVETPFASS